MGIQIDCEGYYREVIEKTENIVTKGVRQYGRAPRLLIVSIETSVASSSYLRGKLKDCNITGIEVSNLLLKSNITQEEAEDKIKSLVNHYDGVIIQLPIPSHLCIDKLKQLINDDKDIDGLKKTSRFIPCTPLGIIRLLKYNYINLKGKKVVVIGRSELVGRPVANMLLDMDATVTICHSNTLDIAGFTRMADLIVSCTGQINLITPDMIKENCILIDVGINKTENGSLCGDISRECYSKASKYTPVPKGIGLVTRATLLENLMVAYWLNINK